MEHLFKVTKQFEHLPLCHSTAQGNYLILIKTLILSLFGVVILLVCLTHFIERFYATRINKESLLTNYEKDSDMLNWCRLQLSDSTSYQSSEGDDRTTIGG